MEKMLIEKQTANKCREISKKLHFVFLLNKVWLAWKKCQRQERREEGDCGNYKFLCWRLKDDDDACDVWDWKISLFPLVCLAFIASQSPRSGVNMNYTFFTSLFFPSLFHHKKSSRSHSWGVFFLFPIVPLSVVSIPALLLTTRRGTSTIKWGVHKNTTLISPARLLNYFFPPYSFFHIFFPSLPSLLIPHLPSPTPKRNWKTMRRVIEKIWLYYLFVTVQRCVQNWSCGDFCSDSWAFGGN